MKIGILTYHWVPNFGANLQALSTYSYLENSGNTPYIINWIPRDLENYFAKRVPATQFDAHRRFVSQRFKNITSECRNSKDVARVIEENGIEKVIIGSDAVFTFVPFLRRFHLSKKCFLRYERPFQDSCIPGVFWGDFLRYLTRPIKIVGLSVSAQNTHFLSVLLPEKKVLKDSLSSFSYLSVRDIWTQKMVSYMMGRERIPKITPDPVFAFEQNVKSQIIQDPQFSNLGKYALLSLSAPYYDEAWVKELESLFSEMGITLIGLPQTNRVFESPLKKNLVFPIDPLDWYLLIKNSCGYIGELMHPILVSLHNSIPVYAFDRYGFISKSFFDESSSKTYQIMNRFNLLDNYYNSKQSTIRPSPDTVYRQIMNFNKDYCRSVSDSLLGQYNRMMIEILSI